MQTIPFLIHPPLTIFPLPILCLVILLEIMSKVNPQYSSPKIIFLLLICFLISMTAAFFSGYHANEYADMTFKITDDIISTHHTWGRLAFILSFPLLAFNWISQKALFNKKIWHSIYYILLLTVALLIIWTGSLGGKLVFEHGAGVYATIPT